MYNLFNHTFLNLFNHFINIIISISSNTYLYLI